MDKELVKHFVKEYKEELEWKKNNGPITITADQMWPYSGKVEETSITLCKWNTNIIPGYGGHKLHDKRKEAKAKE